MKTLRLVTVVAMIGIHQPADGSTTAGSPSASAAIQAQATAQGSAPEACALFTLDEAGKAVGRSFRRARPGKQPGATTCALLGGMGGTINISVSPSGSKKEFDEFRKVLADEGEKVEAVSGVGDDAYYWGARLYVRVGNRWLVMWNGDPNQPVEKGRAEVLALARLGVPKLR